MEARWVDPPFNCPQSLYMYLDALSAHCHAILLGTNTDCIIGLAHKYRLAVRLRE